MRKLLSIRKANSIIESFKKARVLVVGDLIMDHFIWGSVNRISPEAPVPVVDVKSDSMMFGGGANVAGNIRSLGGRCSVTGIVGRDSDGRKLLKDLTAKKISIDGVVVDSKRPTTVKTRIIAHNQQVVRFDRESRNTISPRVAAKVLDYIKKSIKNVDAIVISDYAKGLVTRELLREINEIAGSASVPVAVDPKVDNFDFYKDVSIVTPNNLEASRASGVEITDSKSLKRAGSVLSEMLGTAALLVTRGEHGMSLFEGSSEVHIPTVAKEVYDVSGAGDTVIGVIGLALASGANFKEAAVLANFAAGIVVGKIGTATVTLDELRDAVSVGLKRA
ncbi:MAG: D-glycero-beta-D-manno-heptose-7-phosphate kinase [Thermodesulfobacteriota bacterium]